MALEKRKEKLAKPDVFFKRMLRNIIIAFFFLGVSLFAGMAGYRYFCGLSWVDSLLNASMILGGMGPVDLIQNDAGKIFASVYAIYSGVAFLGAFAILIVPIYHRFLHRFHLQDENDDSE